MEHNRAMTKNFRRFLAAVRELQDRPAGMEGMAIVWGEPGEGKTTAVAYACNALDGVYIHVMPTWKVRKLLAGLSIELGGEEGRFIDPMVDFVIERLSERPRPIFIDEADRLFNDPKMLSTLRAIYDVTGSPIVLIGMEKFARKVQSRAKYARRITQWVEFSGIDMDDAALVASVYDVKLDDDFMRYIYKESRANIGYMSDAFIKLRSFAKLNGLDVVTRKDWPKDKPLVFRDPRFRKKMGA